MIDVGSETVYFACDECGICEQLGSRLRCAEETGTVLQFDHCSCDKIGHEFFIGDYCEDAFIERAAEKTKGKRKTGRAYRRKMHRKNVRKYRDGFRWIWGPCIHGHWNGDEYVFDSYVTHPKNSTNKGFFKRVSNKKVRSHQGRIPKGSWYRKIFDYWWAID